ncbi:GntR family transcriptional regulator [Streptomyces sp. NPDC059985]|uniref:GntR family transcriptional regulator n=1 Tax=Streptomyces sp. NPDC059985 TaxID=3347025 RepID=UPI00369AC730
MSESNPRGTYAVVSEALRAQLAEGAYSDGLPSEAEIGRKFGVARTTVRRALRALEDAGEISAVPGVGWQISSAGRVAPYERIMKDLQRQIKDGSLSAGARLPSEAELAQAYGVARGTVRRAVGELEVAGYVEARQGVGRFVKPT